MANKVRFVTVDVVGSNVRVFGDNGGYLTTIYRPGIKTAQSMGSQVVCDDGTNVTVFECADGCPRQVSNRYKTH